jgi:hypothetical protein
LQNTSDEKIKLRSLTLEAPKMRGRARAPLQQMDLAARLYPNEQVSLTALIQMDPTTPPGTYRAAVLLGDRRQPVIIHVTEEIDLRLTPNRVSIYTEGERTFEREFVVENAGNVPLRLGGKCLGPLTDSMELRGAIRRGLEGACEAEPRDVLKKFLCAWAEEQAGDVLLTREDVTLAPGETRQMTGTFRLPTNLRRFRRYDADLALYTATLHLEVYTGDLRKEQGDTEEKKR